MLFSCKGKQPRHFPFGQISPKCHVTTLNQPIRSIYSLKFPNSRWNLWDIVRVHLKFFPHLKSKAVRTALLKTHQSGQDPKMVLLCYRSTLINSKLPLPAELMNSMMYRILLHEQCLKREGGVTHKDNVHLNGWQSKHNNAHWIRTVNIRVKLLIG